MLYFSITNIATFNSIVKVQNNELKGDLDVQYTYATYPLYKRNDSGKFILFNDTSAPGDNFSSNICMLLVIKDSYYVR